MEIERLSAPTLILCNLIIIWYHSRHRRNWARGFFPVLSITCPVDWASGSSHNWDCFELYPQRLNLLKKKSLNGCFCFDCDTKCFKSPLSIILGHCKPENNPAGCRTNARIPGIRFILKLDLSQKNSSFTNGDMVLSQLICTSLKIEEERLPLQLFIIKMLRSSSGKLGDKAAAAFYTVTHMLLLTCMEFTEHILMITGNVWNIDIIIHQQWDPIVSLEASKATRSHSSLFGQGNLSLMQSLSVSTQHCCP